MSQSPSPLMFPLGHSLSADATAPPTCRVGSGTPSPADLLARPPSWASHVARICSFTADGGVEEAQACPCAERLRSKTAWCVRGHSRRTSERGGTRRRRPRAVDPWRVLRGAALWRQGGGAAGRLRREQAPFGGARCPRLCGGSRTLCKAHQTVRFEWVSLWHVNRISTKLCEISLKSTR